MLLLLTQPLMFLLSPFSGVFEYLCDEPDLLKHAIFVADEVKTKERRGQTISVTVVASLESIVDSSTCEDFKRWEFKS